MRITIHKLKVEMLLGVHEWEKRAPQAVYVTLNLTYNADTAARSDHIGDALDYDRIADAIADLLQSRPFELIETAAQALLDHLMAAFPFTFARVELEKPAAIPAAQGVSVTVEQTR